MSQRPWILLVKPPRDRPKAFAVAPFCARCRDVAANRGAVDHVLPVIGQPDIDHRLQQSIPDALFSPTPEPDIDRVPLPIALLHVAPRAADPQHMKHTIEKTPIIARWPCPASPFRWQERPNKRPFFVRQITTAHDYSSKSSLGSETTPPGNPFCQHGLR